MLAGMVRIEKRWNQPVWYWVKVSWICECMNAQRAPADYTIIQEQNIGYFWNDAILLRMSGWRYIQWNNVLHLVYWTCPVICQRGNTYSVSTWELLLIIQHRLCEQLGAGRGKWETVGHCVTEKVTEVYKYVHRWTKYSKMSQSSTVYFPIE